MLKMEIVSKAIEMNATVDEKRHLILDESLPINGPARVKVIILITSDEEINETTWLRAGASNDAFDFLKDKEEDIYSPEDGKPFHD